MTFQPACGKKKWKGERGSEPPPFCDIYQWKGFPFTWIESSKACAFITRLLIIDFIKVRLCFFFLLIGNQVYLWFVVVLTVKWTRSWIRMKDHFCNWISIVWDLCLGLCVVGTWKVKNLKFKEMLIYD